MQGLARPFARNAARWETDELRQLTEFVALGRSVPEIARAFGRTQEAIRAKAQRLGLLTPRRRKAAGGPSPLRATV